MFVLYQSGWCGQVHPNLTQPWDTFSHNSTEHCTHPRRCWEHPTPHKKKCKVGCLFDILADPEERKDLAREMPEKAREILDKMKEAEKHWFDPDRSPAAIGLNGTTTRWHACVVARTSGFYQPYLP